MVLRCFCSLLISTAFINYGETGVRLGLILGDQLSDSLATLRVLDAGNDVIVMAEVPEEATYVRHHKQKIALLFSAMRHFAARLQDAGWQVRY